MDRAGTVGLFQTMAVETLDRSGEAVTLADSAYVDHVAVLECVSLDQVADIEGVHVVEFELAEDFLVADISLVEVPLHGFVCFLYACIAKSKLQCAIAVCFDSLLLNDRARACLDDCHGNDLTVLIEQLGHTDFLSDNTFLHECIPPFRLLAGFRQHDP